MLVIRLTRFGKKKKPFYRIVVAEDSAPIKGKYLDKIGHYDPLIDPPVIFVDKDKAERWLKQGAKPSDTAWNLLVEAGLLKKKIITKRAKKKKEKKEVEEKPIKPEKIEKEEKQTPKPEGQALPGVVEEKPLVSPREQEKQAEKQKEQVLPKTARLPASEDSEGGQAEEKPAVSPLNKEENASKQEGSSTNA